MDIRDQVLGLLRQELDAYHLQTGIRLGVELETPLFGNGAALDSIGLVMVITGLEARVNDTLDTDLILASEKAMSMNRSPFRTIGTLVDYTCDLLGNA